MKKFLVVTVLAVAVLAPVFGQEEYTLYYSGDVEGFVNIQRDSGEKVTIAIRSLTPPRPLIWCLTRISAASASILPSAGKAAPTRKGLGV